MTSLSENISGVSENIHKLSKNIHEFSEKTYTELSEKISVVSEKAHKLSKKIDKKYPGTSVKIYPGLSNLANYDFIKENPIYLIYHVVTISIALFIFIKIYTIISGVKYFFFDGIPLFYQDLISEICNSNIKYSLPFLIPIYNPLFLLFYLIPLFNLFSYLPVSFVNSDDKETRNVTFQRAYGTYYLSSVLFLYTIVFNSCGVTDATVVE
jgi:hypothetical protein